MDSYLPFENLLNTFNPVVTSFGDAVVPSSGSGLPPAFGGALSGSANLVQTPRMQNHFKPADAGFYGDVGGSHMAPTSSAPGQQIQTGFVVPQAPNASLRKVALTAAQQSELEIARKRALKAAAGRRANMKRNASDAAEADDISSEFLSGEDKFGGEEDIEAKLATVTDEKEGKRLKRLLRNRVSAQQARERKKNYVNTLEAISKEQNQKLSQLEHRVKTLERENFMLRQVIGTMKSTAGGDGTVPSVMH